MLQLLVAVVVVIGSSVLDIDDNVTPSQVADPQKSVVTGDTVDVYCDDKCPEDPWASEVSYIFDNGRLSYVFVVPVEDFVVPDEWVESKKNRIKHDIDRHDKKRYYTYNSKSIVYYNGKMLGYPYIVITPK